MTEQKLLKNAPITEALLDIRVRPSTQTELSRLAAFQDDIRERYPSKQQRVSWQSSIQFKPGTPPEMETAGGPEGYVFFSADGRQAVQSRINGFSFSRMRPYESWSALRGEARELWEHYVRVVSPESVTRIALRYINRIELPLPIRDFKDWFTTVPEVAPGLPQGLASFFMRLVLPEPATGVVAIITEALEAPSGGDDKQLPVILDIDAFAERSFEVSTDELWNHFEKLREFKNKAFFESITDRARRLFL